MLHRRTFGGDAIGILKVARQDTFERFDGVVVLLDEFRELAHSSTDVDCCRRVGNIERSEKSSESIVGLIRLADSGDLSRKRRLACRDSS